MSEDERKTFEILLERKLKLSELLTVKNVENKSKSNKPAKIKAETLGEVKLQPRKPKRAPSKVWSLTEKGVERLLEKQRKREAVEMLEALNQKAIANAKRKEKEERVKEMRSKAIQLYRAEQERKEKFEEEPKKPANALPRKQWRLLLNGRKEGHKNRQKNRIVEVRKPSKVLYHEYTTKKGQLKNRYITINNPELRKIAVIDRTKILPKFEKQKEEA